MLGRGHGVGKKPRFHTAILLVILLLLFPTTFLRGEEAPIRIALTAAAVRDELQFYDRWASYLTRRLGRPVQFVQRRSYRDALEMLRTGELDFSWTCSYSFLQAYDAGLADLVAAPVFEGKPLYRSYIIVHRDSPVTGIKQLEGKSFAYTDPDSNTGYLVPRSMIAALHANPDKFFRYSFFTWDHGQAIEAVADKVADGASVDAYVWEFLATIRPQLTEKTKIVQRSSYFGFPPIVARRGLDPKVKTSFANALFSMRKDPEGQILLKQMLLDDFVEVPLTNYDTVRSTAAGLKKGSWH